MDGSLDCLSIVGGGTAVIGTAGCSDDSGRLRIEVSPNTPVTVTSQGDGTVSVGDLRAPLIVSLTGSGDLTAGRSDGLTISIRGSGAVTAGDIDGPVTIDTTGSGDVRIKRVNGTLTMRQRSSTDLAVGAIEAGNVVLDAAGSGDMLIGRGNIGQLQVRINGSSDLSVAATVHDANVSASGGGDVRLGKVTGNLSRSAAGGSDIVVGGSDLVNTVIGEVTRKIGDSSSDITINTHSGSGPGVDHFLAIIVAGIVLYIVFRIVRNSGGIAGLRARSGGAPPGAPTNPSVIALCETMARLDQRLGRLEGYVTTREFDLNRKFREMGS
jgi:hypothetical protein